MKLVIQRVLNSQVDVDGKTVGKIGKGFMVLCGITHQDSEKEADILARKLCNLRVFEDENGSKTIVINKESTSVKINENIAVEISGSSALHNNKGISLDVYYN